MVFKREHVGVGVDAGWLAGDRVRDMCAGVRAACVWAGSLPCGTTVSRICLGEARSLSGGAQESCPFGVHISRK
jgi:hypothetical protein